MIEIAFFTFIAWVGYWVATRDYAALATGFADFTVSPLWGVFLYLVPLVFCVLFYTARTVRNYRKDLTARTEDRYYTPTDTIGCLIGRALVSVIPVANLWAALFDLAPGVFGSFFERLGRVFDQPLVPRQRQKDTAK